MAFTIKHDFVVGPQDDVQQQEGDTLSRLRIDGEEKTDFDDDISVGSVKTSQVAYKDISFVYVCAELESKNKLIRGKFNEAPSPIKIRETTARIVHQTDVVTTRCEVPTISQFNVEQMEDAYRCKATKQIEMSGTKCYVDYDKIQIWASKNWRLPEERGDIA